MPAFRMSFKSTLISMGEWYYSWYIRLPFSTRDYTLSKSNLMILRSGMF